MRGYSEYPETALRNVTDCERPALVRMCSKIALNTNRCRWRDVLSSGVCINCAHTREDNPSLWGERGVGLTGTEPESFEG